MFKLAIILCVSLWLLPASGQVGGRAASPSEFRNGLNAGMHYSLTGQFVIHETAGGGYPIPLGNNPGVRYVRIDPTLLAVSCERIKHALLTRIDAQDKWQDKIYIDLQPAQTLNDTIVIAASPFGHYWNYHVRLPDTLEHSRLITTVMDVLLLEMANRHAQRSAEIPAWLLHGLSQEVSRGSRVDMVIERGQPVAAGLNISVLDDLQTNANPLALAQAELRSSPPLTLEQLSWPDEAQLEGTAGEVFRNSAQLYAHELLQLKDGRAALRAFIEELPQHLNWQLTFLHAFRANFPTQLEVEKWWALRVVDFAGRDLSLNWSAEESWKKLNEIVRPTVEVRTHLDELPFRTEVPLQTIIGQWDVGRQVGFLSDRSQQLYRLRSRVSQETAKLVDDYRRTLDIYMAKRKHAGILRSAKAQAVLGLDRPAQDAINQLDVLDGIREDLRPKPINVQSANVNQTAGQ